MRIETKFRDYKEVYYRDTLVQIATAIDGTVYRRQSVKNGSGSVNFTGWSKVVVKFDTT